MGIISSKYGYKFQEGLTRAFQKEFGITPGDLRRSALNLNLLAELMIFPSCYSPNSLRSLWWQRICKLFEL